MVFDITKLDAIPDVVRKITTAHTDIDCVVLNSGIQRRSGKQNDSSLLPMLIPGA